IPVPGGWHMTRLAAVAGAVLLAGGAPGPGEAGGKGENTPRYRGGPGAQREPPHTPPDAPGSPPPGPGGRDIRFPRTRPSGAAVVDQRVAMYAAQVGGNLSAQQKTTLAFGRLTKVTAEHFQEDPTKLKELQRFFQEGEWEERDNAAVARVKGLEARKVFMKK